MKKFTTVEAYKQATASVKWKDQPEALQAGHEFVLDAGDLYGEDDKITKAIDNHIALVNDFGLFKCDAAKPKPKAEPKAPAKADYPKNLAQFKAYIKNNLYGKIWVVSTVEPWRMNSERVITKAQTESFATSFKDPESNVKKESWKEYRKASEWTFNEWGAVWTAGGKTVISYIYTEAEFKKRADIWQKETAKPKAEPKTKPKYNVGDNLTHIITKSSGVVKERQYWTEHDLEDSLVQVLPGWKYLIDGSGVWQPENIFRPTPKAEPTAKPKPAPKDAPSYKVLHTSDTYSIHQYRDGKKLVTGDRVKDAGVKAALKLAGAHFNPKMKVGGKLTHGYTIEGTVDEVRDIVENAKAVAIQTPKGKLPGRYPDRIRTILEQLAEADPDMSKQEVLEWAARITEMRPTRSVVNDNAKEASKVLDPTYTNLLRWAMNPGRYDLRGVDIAASKPATVEARLTPKSFFESIGIDFNF